VTTFTPRKVSARILLFIALAEIILGVFINPWVAPLWDKPPANWQNDYQLVTLHFFVAAIVTACVTAVWSCLIWRRTHRVFDNLALTFLILSLVVLCDRLLLRHFGQSIWIADPKVHFRHRPNAVRTWPEVYTRGSPKPVRINHWGFHDDDFPLTKPDGEFRALVLGDSVTMGHGVTEDETYVNQLEDLLNRSSSQYRHHQIINTAVSGYGTQQEYEILKESLRFDPDMVLVGFCMNDATEPFVTNRDLGGVGFGNQGITQYKNRLLGFLFHETGFGRWIESLTTRSKLQRNLARQEVYNVEYMSQHLHDDPRIERAWHIVLTDLEKIYRLCEKNNIPVILLIFPHTFQLGRDVNAATPQRLLKEHAQRFQVPVIDFTMVFQFKIADQIIEYNKHEVPEPAVNALLSRYLLKFYLDWDHLSVQGHRVAAQVIFDYLHDQEFITPAAH